MPQWCQFIWNEPLFWRIVLLSEGLPVEAIKATLKRAGDPCALDVRIYFTSPYKSAHSGTAEILGSMN
jgi:hypothetical protein